MQSVACRTCGTRVLAEKNGMFHTNIQWLDGEAPHACTRFGDLSRRTCPDLHGSVDELASDGTLPVTRRVDPVLPRTTAAREPVRPAAGR